MPRDRTKRRYNGRFIPTVFFWLCQIYYVACFNDSCIRYNRTTKLHDRSTSVLSPPLSPPGRLRFPHWLRVRLSTSCFHMLTTALHANAPRRHICSRYTFRGELKRQTIGKPRRELPLHLCSDTTETNTPISNCTPRSNCSAIGEACLCFGRRR